MVLWVRFEESGKTGFGTLEGDKIAVHEGDMFDRAKPAGRTVSRGAVRLLTPCTPSKPPIAPAPTTQTLIAMEISSRSARRKPAYFFSVA